MNVSEEKEITTDMINKMIQDYRWMKAEIKRLQKVLFGEIIPMRNWGVAKYGDEAVFSNGSSLKSEAEIKQMDIREEKQYERLILIERRVYALEYVFQILETELYKTIYDLLLDGMTYRYISKHLALSKDFVQSVKKDVIVQIRQNRQISDILTKPIEFAI